jgi:hypothetical protein
MDIVWSIILKNPTKVTSFVGNGRIFQGGEQSCGSYFAIFVL